MPAIGIPESSQRNPLANVAIKKDAPKANPAQAGGEESVADALKRITGQETTNVKYVDAKKHNKMGKDEFMKLLAVQMKNQDPLNPMDEKKFTSELAQFTQLESLANIQKAIEDQAVNKKEAAKVSGAQFLGKEVMTKGTSLDYPGEGHMDVPFFLSKDAKNALVRLYDSKKQMMAEIPLENLNKGSQTIQWDGKQLDGQPSVKDTYTVEVRAWDKDMNQFMGETKTTGIVTDVTFEGNDTILKIDGKKSVFLRDVDTFKLPEHNKKSETPNPAMINQALNEYKKNLESNNQ